MCIGSYEESKLPTWTDKCMYTRVRTLPDLEVCIKAEFKVRYHELINSAFLLLKHKDSFGKSENLSKIFFAEILVFDHDYEGKSSSSNGLL